MTRSAPFETAWRMNRLPSSTSYQTLGMPFCTFSFGPAWFGPTCMRGVVSFARRAQASLPASGSLPLRHSIGQLQ